MPSALKHVRYARGVLIIGVSLMAAQSQMVPLHRQKGDCKRRTVEPNLLVPERVRVEGVLSDQTGDFFRSSRVALRVWHSRSHQVLVREVVTDERGHFDLGSVDAGRYRILAVDAKGFTQPNLVICPKSDCKIDQVLRVGSTDTLEAICPIK